MNQIQARNLNELYSACAASIVKFTYLPSYGKTGDFLWDSRNLTIWSVVEGNLGILTAVSNPMQFKCSSIRRQELTICQTSLFHV